MGEGRTPGGGGDGADIDGGEGAVDTSESAGARESAMLRLRNAILRLWGFVSRRNMLWKAYR
jgi:hypothetical protein